MRVSEYFKDSDVVVKLAGKPVNMADLQEDYELGDKIAIRTPQGLLTVTSTLGKEAKTIKKHCPQEIAEQIYYPRIQQRNSQFWKRRPYGL